MLFLVPVVFVDRGNVCGNFGNVFVAKFGPSVVLLDLVVLDFVILTE